MFGIDPRPPTECAAPRRHFDGTSRKCGEVEQLEGLEALSDRLIATMSVAGTCAWNLRSGIWPVRWRDISHMWAPTTPWQELPPCSQGFHVADLQYARASLMRSAARLGRGDASECVLGALAHDDDDDDRTDVPVDTTMDVTQPMAFLRRHVAHMKRLMESHAYWLLCCRAFRVVSKSK